MADANSGRKSTGSGGVSVRTTVQRGELRVVVQGDGTVVISLEGCSNRVIATVVKKAEGGTKLELGLHEEGEYTPCQLVPRKPAQPSAEEEPPNGQLPEESLKE